MTTEVESAIAEAEEIETTPVSGDFNDRMKHYARLEHLRRKLDEAQKILKSQIAEISEPLIEEMGLNGIDKTTIDGLTIFTRTDFYVSKRGEIPSEELVKEMNNCGLGYMVKDSYSASSLKAKLKEWRVEGIEIPERLEKMLNIGETVKLTSRK